MIPPVLMAALAGALLWTLAEYLLHRFLGHGRRGRRLFTREHLRHHRELTWFSPTWRKLVLGVGLLLILGPALALLAGPAGVALLVGFLATYGLYERVHRRLHTHPPQGPWGRWARRNHWRHHSTAPRSNHGVLVPWWDRVFGTSNPGTVTIHADRAPAWLLTPSRGEPWRADYVVIGAAHRPTPGSTGHAADPANGSPDRR